MLGQIWHRPSCTYFRGDLGRIGVAFVPKPISRQIKAQEGCGVDEVKVNHGAGISERGGGAEDMHAFFKMLVEVFGINFLVFNAYVLEQRIGSNCGLCHLGNLAKGDQ